MLNQAEILARVYEIILSFVEEEKADPDVAGEQDRLGVETRGGLASDDLIIQCMSSRDENQPSPTETPLNDGEVGMGKPHQGRNNA